MIGWAAGDNYKTPLIEKAIEMAARSYPLAGNAIFHSDRGSNYTSCQFAATLKKYGIRHSAGRTGVCYDNAMAESFFAGAEERARSPHPVSDPRARAPRRCEVYRILVQFKTSALRTSVPDPAASPKRIPGTAVRSVN